MINNLSVVVNGGSDPRSDKRGIHIPNKYSQPSMGSRLELLGVSQPSIRKCCEIGDRNHPKNIGIR